MKKNKTIALSALLLGMAFAANAQNVWTGTATPTTTTGKVGIGVSSPAAQLDISTGSPYPVGLKVKRTGLVSGFNNIVEVWNYGTELDFWIDGGGYVGIQRLASPGANKMVTVGSSGILETQAIPAAQTLSISGSTLSISGGNSVSLPPSAGDNLGNHTATTDLNMNLRSIMGIRTIAGMGGNSIDLWGPFIKCNNQVHIGSIGSGTYELYVDGEAYCTTSWQTSDKKFKKNINELPSIKDQLFQLKPYSYEFKTEEYKGKRNFDNRTHYGFIAQEIEPLFPNLIHKDENGEYAVNYTEFIPLLLQALKEQDQKITALEASIEEQDKRITALEDAINGMPLKNNEPVNNAVALLKGSLLYQNTPNPFNRETTIRFSITGKFDNAFIGIYDLNGKQIKRMTIREANAQIVVPANILSPGTYIYSLVVEGQLIDSKKMVVID